MPEMTEKEYLDWGGVKCPNCGSYNISGGEWNADAGGATQEVDCGDCNATWLDCYTLTGIINFEKPEEDNVKP